ncbi:GNAT family N-acetyltransferase [Dyadobacter sp. CY356]|uniref:GNAT family N-acetyltransferase n=1 Tax=Dyadobacter sp. CY356 TaxID=2906442 RepID=UPI001F1D1A3E|nr:GNAT family N-acetyltransferase [Dyadobacter sp. CY356]MCF0056878.1 GNAT family N-acetyltransferase [Dyadobacter sp. CY356]
MTLKYENATIEDFRSLIITVDEFYKYLAEEKNEVYDADKANTRNKRYLRKFLEDDNCTYIICKREKKIVGYGFLSIEKANQKVAYINEFFVLPEDRKKGIGYSILLESLKWLRSKNCKTTILSVNQKNKSAINLYQKAGFSLNEPSYVDMSFTIR